jgi:hypothetical protein
MSKKHFIELADHVRKPGHLPSRIQTVLECYDHRLDHNEVAAMKDLLLRTIADELADYCKSQNGAFNRERWMAYINGECGPNGGAIKRVA